VIEYILIGGGFAFAAAAQPGPLQAFLLSRVAAVGWKRTLPAAFAPLISDGPIALIMLTLLHRVAHGFEAILRGAGGLVLLYFAFRTFMEWRRFGKGSERESPSSPRTLLQAVAVNFINPGPWIGWSLIVGPVALKAWAETPVNAIVLVASFYIVMVGSLLAFIMALGTTSCLGPRGRRGLLLSASVVLAGLAIYSLISILV
jgi:threonine/homoserine/homoserine lactone efflux protein